MKVAITLDPNQSYEEGEEELFKALDSQRQGIPHDEDNFPDPAMEHTAYLMKEGYRLIFADMMREILEVLDEGDESL